MYFCFYFMIRFYDLDLSIFINDFEDTVEKKYKIDTKDKFVIGSLLFRTLFTFSFQRWNSIWNNLPI